VRLRDAREMLAPGALGELGPTTWADLGCGDGLFTRALAEVLAAGSVIHAMDQDRGALRKVPARQGDVDIVAHHGDFTRQPWGFGEFDGVLMANSLHYVGEQAAFIGRCARQMKAAHRFLIVEYDLAVANPWVPYPINRERLSTLFTAAGYSSIAILSTRPSRYQRGSLYSALITP
jgi:SAM-dependent methyltransferase